MKKMDLIYEIIKNIDSDKRINTIYTVKFDKDALLSPPFGSWFINGFYAINNGIILTPSENWNTYMQFTQPMHFDCDGVKWKIRLKDKNSKIRVERRTSPMNVGFSSTVELDNCVMRIYQSAVSATEIPSTVIAEKATVLELGKGREYNLVLESFGEVLEFTIEDSVTGEKDTISYISTGKGVKNAGRCWDYPRFYVYKGCVEILQFDYFSNFPHSPKALLLGDSIMEGDTIRNLPGGGYNNRWAGMLYKKLNGNVAILGTAGETSSGIIRKLPVLDRAFKKPEYVFLAHMVNDYVFDVWKTNTEKVIQLFKRKGSTPIICMMPMRSGREEFYDAVLDYVEKCPYNVIYFNKALTVNSDGKTPDKKYYIGDKIHPNVLGHSKMFEQVLQDLDFI